MDTDAKWLIICAVIFFVSCSALTITIPDDTKPLAVTRQSGFVIEVDNDLMITACKYHNIDSDAILWDTVNDNFMFYRDDQKCFVFTTAFKEYLNER